MTFLDLFAGIGGFRRGMELAGHECVGFCEWDKNARMSYISMHCLTQTQRSFLLTLDLKQRQKEILKDEYLNGEWCSTDIRAVDASNIPKADCWCFGAPCQDFSVAGKRAGLQGDRSSLVREVFRILKEIREEDRPEWLIYENVKGMLSSNRGFDFLSILLELDERGYDVEWQLLNSKLHGVPQNRERVYTIGHLRAKGCRKIFPLSGEHKEDHAQHESISPYVVLPCLTPNRTEKRQNGRRFKDDAEPSFTLTSQDIHGVGIEVRPEALRKTRTEYGKAIHKNYEAGILKISRHNFLAYETRADGVTNTLDTVQKDDYISIPIAVAKGHTEVCAGTMTELEPNCHVYAAWYEKYHCYIAIRKLTPKECFRLQGWTDDYFEKAQFVNLDSQLYRQAGNGVTVNVVYDIAKKIIDE